MTNYSDAKRLKESDAGGLNVKCHVLVCCSTAGTPNNRRRAAAMVLLLLPLNGSAEETLAATRGTIAHK